ncbi:Beta-grasp domain,Molybdopterin synthase/thiamin biosynthesis sulphur carrier, beta- [Cinara cedri]|uniref:Beta-grasp domain,Molybdopterin synthase/thiamin biosynthesis sulphur carrier, beta n=1 Tax=Cinara cedri TaxID=506608 RepID=A0A5E4MT85_9HEMI|nr:Beta-grasp domain,Molybdopterin synthase/thiamin biosynthesis sulphur carrier, beta- [Cinara cedri]
MTKVTVIILFFAQARELAKLNKTTLQVPQTLFVHELRSILVEKYNLTTIGNIFILAVNEIYISDNLRITLQENDVLAVIPPISGG